MTYFLIIISLSLIILNIISIKKDKSSFKSILINKEGNLQSYEIEIGKLRQEMGETILDIQSEMEELKEKFNKLEYIIKEEDTLKNSEVLPDNNSINKNSIKLKEVKKLIDEGMNEEEIAEVLHIGRGEVLLIKELYLK